ncbi:hypothetical protein SSBR45G_51890 [Bradyrhizobium sp. SSBR45G]|uniref:hypothetical protein n=1 Tax=unclassified Bradyrhizobium TaxID=2631580 RepID=UPI002342A696|nr:MULTISPECIES: hypothetical protein [unclassified Bradyrhizobium]GLH80280.1 hypothetical protein SSBR45G_51890 [Bradyrhizobium sp. SSBR45G]GLH87774.1 hypothetical protein SSBR45R_52340 [Bradyrhizobium sp. SSBR45R]
MTNSYAEMRVNPFEDAIVREPRDVTFSVNGLNDAPLDRVLAKFAALDGGELPRSSPVKADRAQLVVSPDRGYGKSHLLGRLFTALGRKATKVYLRPFQDPYKAWQSILLLTLQELDRPDDETAQAPSQLSSLAVGTLAHIVADFAQNGAPEIAAAVPALRRLASGTLPAAEMPGRRAWLGALFAGNGPINRLAGLLGSRHIDLHGREKAWLKVLVACAFDDADSERRRAALKWLRAEPLEQDEVEQLRLDQADNDGRGDVTPQEINALSFRRLQGLCQLASYYRPFVFCFDQTECYANDPMLIKALGNCIEQLYAELRNHLTVVTANQRNWVEDIKPHLEPAHRDRFSQEIALEGINKAGARELIEARLRHCEMAAGDVARFFADNWLEDLFSTLVELGVRALLMRAEDRFRALARPDAAPPPPQTLDDLFQVELNNIRAQKALQAYNQDCLMWFAKDVGQAMTGVKVGRTSGRRYFSFEWRWPDRSVYFAFEGGDHWRRWKAIADEAIAMATAQGDRRILAYVFRTPDLARVPRPSWAVAKATMDKASGHGFRIVELTADQVCELHAARELYSNALQGNIAFSGPAALAWLQARFAPFLADIAAAGLPIQVRSIDAGGPAAQQPKTTERTSAAADMLDAERLRVVLDLVREQRIVDISVVLARLGRTELRDPLLRSVEAHPNLKAHPGPKTIFLQWRITA